MATIAPPRFDAIVLSGGRARRLGGVAKAELVVGGVTLLRRTLDAVYQARSTVVAGPASALHPAHFTVREHPAGAGPVAAIAAGLAHEAIVGPWVAVIACDVPGAAGAVDTLLPVVEGAASDAVMALDASGQRQSLLAFYRLAALRQALSRLGDPDGASMRDLTREMRVTEIALDDAFTRDVDTWDDFERAKEEYS